MGGQEVKPAVLDSAIFPLWKSQDKQQLPLNPEVSEVVASRMY